MAGEAPSLGWKIEDFLPDSGVQPFSAADFLTPTPYEFVYSFHTNPFSEEQVVKILSDYAKRQGFIGFGKQWKSYLKTLKQGVSGISAGDNPTAFTDQPLELNAGTWTADDTGVFRDSVYGLEYACMHPLMITERVENLDTGAESVKLAFRRGKVWRSLIVDKQTISTASKVPALSASGVLATSENAKNMVRYLSDLDALNYDVIPTRQSVGRLGYISGHGFSPYIPELIFDGEASFRTVFHAVTAKGNPAYWKRTALKCRETSVAAAIVLASSFASVLVEPLGILPFFVHLWGSDSGTGKTVALMMAASVWGNPEMGMLVKTFNATGVGFERMAAFLNHLPMCIDELQLTRKSGQGKSAFSVYDLAEGVGRTRGLKSGGIETTATWRNAILTTGESPLNSEAAGAGAINRVLEIECTADSVVIQNGRAVSAALKGHYGHAGRQFVEHLYNEEGEIPQEVHDYYNAVFGQLAAKDTTEKQAISAAAVLTADKFMCEWIFDGKAEPLTVETISSFLASKSAASLGQRGYDWLCDWVSVNASKFTGGNVETTGENYGVLSDDGDCAYIIRAIFDRVVADAGFNERALLSYLRKNNLIRTTGSERRFDMRKRMAGTNPRCICLLLPKESAENHCEIEPL